VTNTNGFFQSSKRIAQAEKLLDICQNRVHRIDHVPTQHLPVILATLRDLSKNLPDRADVISGMIGKIIKRQLTLPKDHKVQSNNNVSDSFASVKVAQTQMFAASKDCNDQPNTTISSSSRSGA
jgi:hypothetical protein